ncbi:MAG TPA: glycosyltransferase, partial [Rhizomicrobium sp.]|nr:glycosyltransferase [Rhizomicrobium sp.]
MSNFLHLVGAMALLLSFAGALYTFAASGALAKLLALQNREPATWPAVSILKPLHGADAGLEAALESFFTLDYPAPVQLVFGVARVDDPALPIVRVLMARYPAVDAALVIDERVHGANGKISNLINMLPSAAHDVLVLSDADIAVTPDYLRAVVAALSVPGVGIVTALYSGHGLSGLWSDLAAGGVNYNFLPNVAFAFTRGLARPSFGSTIALRRAVLDEIGGLAP